MQDKTGAPKGAPAATKPRSAVLFWGHEHGVKLGKVHLLGQFQPSLEEKISFVRPRHWHPMWCHHDFQKMKEVISIHKPVQKITVSLPEDVLQLIDKKWPQQGFKNRSAYITNAISQYASQEFLMRFPKELAEIHDHINQPGLKDMENRMGKLSYKIAMEIAQMNVLLASLAGLSYDQSRKTRKKAYDLVQQSRGFVSLPQAARGPVSLEDDGFYTDDDNDGW